ncbi:MAG: hypothetical protein AAFY72_18790 [Cyanobacteria bacterium J06649_4]
MWTLKYPEIKTNVISRESSGQGMAVVSRLVEGDIEIVNDIENLAWQDDALQTIVCHCGVPGCAPGGWVSMRRVERNVVIMPAFGAVASAPPQLQNEYLPPNILLERGTIWLTHTKSEFTTPDLNITAPPICRYA